MERGGRNGHVRLDFYGRCRERSATESGPLQLAATQRVDVRSDGTELLL
jgi:hypothetical protein